MTSPVERLATALAGRYRIERELGAGGMATVYLADDVKHHRQVAIKVLKPELAAVLGADRFVQEIQTTAQLRHPHILPLFDSGEAGGFLFYVMPYVEGETLRNKLDRETQLGIDDAGRITTEVADALDCAHRHGVVHRDIKPENILLHDGRPMVADFGIALALSAAAGGRMTETGMSLGTPHYMSPEQATADKDITGRSDIYSLASVLYEMLTGNPPHMVATPLAGTDGGKAPFFSPDGRWIGHRTADGKVKKLPAAGGGSVTLATDAAVEASAAATWLGGGTIVYAADVGLRRINAAGDRCWPVGPDTAWVGITVLTLSPLPKNRGGCSTRSAAGTAQWRRRCMPSTCAPGKSIYSSPMRSERGTPPAAICCSPIELGGSTARPSIWIGLRSRPGASR